jgi:putative flavoprotein involved in K+ transport
MILVGMTAGYQNGVISFAPDLAANLAHGDANYLSMLDRADAYAAENGFELPEEPEARAIAKEPDCVTDPLSELDLDKAGVATVIWATGYALDFGWLKVGAVDDHGKPRHHRGISSEPGIYFLGLPWLSRRASSFIWGVWHDARFLADHIDQRRKYLAFRPSLDECQ